MRPRSVLLLLTGVMLAGCTATGGAPSTVPTPASSAMPSAGSVSDAAAGLAGSGPRADVLDYRGGPARSGNMPGPGPTGKPTIRWTFQAGAPIASQVAVVGAVVYVVSTDGTIHAVDLGTGKQCWSVPIGAETHGSPSIVDGLLLVSANDGAHAFALADGRAVWTATKIGIVRGAPAVVGHTAVFASDDGTASALDARTGAILWHHTLGSPDTSSVAADEGFVIFGLQNGVVVALALSDGSERWRTDTGDGTRIGTPTIANGRVYIATLDDIGPGTHHIAALDLATGRVLWRFASPGDKPAYTPALADGRAITEGEDGSVSALDAASGTMLWQVKAPGLVEIVPTIAAGTVYGASNGGVAFALDTATGVERWQVPIRGVPYGEAVTAGLVLVGTNLGMLYAIGASAP